jgi:hypothetical protein
VLATLLVFIAVMHRANLILGLLRHVLAIP